MAQTGGVGGWVMLQGEESGGTGRRKGNEKEMKLEEERNWGRSYGCWRYCCMG